MDNLTWGIGKKVAETKVRRKVEDKDSKYLCKTAKCHVDSSSDSIARKTVSGDRILYM